MQAFLITADFSVNAAIASFIQNKFPTVTQQLAVEVQEEQLPLPSTKVPAALNKHEYA